MLRPRSVAKVAAVILIVWVLIVATTETPNPKVERPNTLLHAIDDRTAQAARFRRGAENNRNRECRQTSTESYAFVCGTTVRFPVNHMTGSCSSPSDPIVSGRRILKDGRLTPGYLYLVLLELPLTQIAACETKPNSYYNPATCVSLYLTPAPSELTGSYGVNVPEILADDFKRPFDFRGHTNAPTVFAALDGEVVKFRYTKLIGKNRKVHQTSAC